MDKVTRFVFSFIHHFIVVGPDTLCFDAIKMFFSLTV